MRVAGCPYCGSTRSSIDGGERECQRCGAVFPIPGSSEVSRLPQDGETPASPAAPGSPGKGRGAAGPPGGQP